MSGLLLAGHGSHLRAETAGVVWACVDALRAAAAADEITAAFWKEQPSFRAGPYTMQADRITVVPMFTAAGYFTQTVLPAELAEHRDRILITPPLGQHPLVGRILQTRVAEALQQFGAGEAPTLVVIGHSTRRQPQSRLAAQDHARTLGRHFGLNSQAVYLDDTPEIASIYHSTHSRRLLVVPCFLAAGSHVSFDLPARLGLPAGLSRAHIQGRDLLYTPPIGQPQDLPLLVEAICDLAQLNAPAHNAAGFPLVGATALIEKVRNLGGLAFGQLWLTPAQVSVIGGPADSLQAFASFAALRQHLRQPSPHVFRSLNGQRDLPNNWHWPCTNLEQVPAVVETVYPGALAAWAGAIPQTPLPALLARQTGIYRDLVGGAANTPCPNCAYHPLWANAHPEAGGLPCAEACNHWLAAALASQTAKEVQHER
jgi:sirohydrochlorin cobaltochelatase